MSSSKKDLMINRSSPSMSWRDTRYTRFYEIVDQLVSEVQQLVWKETNTRKRKLGGNELAKLHYSIECLVRDCMAICLFPLKYVQPSLDSPLTFPEQVG